MAEKEMCNCHHGGILKKLGILAVVYGITQYLMVAQGWPAYSAWIAGGVLLIVIAWAKKSMQS